MKSDDENPELEETGELPIVSPADPRVTIIGADIASEAAEGMVVEESILPHWTEAPTGQVPAVLSREPVDGEDPWASIPAPAWREEEADWVAHDEQFDSAILGAEAGSDDARPWEFESTETPVVKEVILAETPRPSPSRPHRTRRPAMENPLAGRAVRASSQKNVTVATLTGFAFAAAVILLFVLGNVWVLALICAALLMASAEAFAAFRRVGAHPATLLGIVATVALSIGAYEKGEAALGLVSALFMLFAVLWYMGAERKVDMLDGLGATIFIYVWVGVLGSFAALLISPVNFAGRHGLFYLLGAMILVVLNDVGALFVGRSFGKKKLAPSISPGKTVAGAVGGAAVSILVGTGVLPLISSQQWNTPHAFIISVALAVVTPIGDLFESMVKRTLGIKDMGELLPGHGGMLDRVDGLLFALPTTYYLVHVLHLT